MASISKQLSPEAKSIFKEWFDKLPQCFEAKTGVEVAERLGMPARTFKSWLNTSLFK